MQMQRFFSLFALAALLLLGPIAATANAMPSPMQDYGSIVEAEAATGVALPPPTILPQGYSLSSVSTIDNKIVQVIYANPQGKTINYRAALGTDDISGVYGTYEEKSMDIGGIPTTTRWDTNGIVVALWKMGAQTFSVYFEEPVTLDFLTRFLQSTVG